MKFQVKIVGVGQDVPLFLEDPENALVILFNEDVPPEFADLAVLHTKSEVFLPPIVGDTMAFGDKLFEITAVGPVALETLKNLGHCTIGFTGAKEVPLPGYLMLRGPEDITMDDLVPGAEISIF